MRYFEVNFDGLVGPTHHYAGLSEGNIASMKNARQPANPKEAALQGLSKMKTLLEMGFVQCVLPPHPRPNLNLLKQLGFNGTTDQCLYRAYREAPQILSACYSASSMWTANAATTTPSCDSIDGKVHFTAANLISNLHRHQEAGLNQKLFETIFANPEFFTHHAPLPASSTLGDEGAANHLRLCRGYEQKGLHLFVYGKQAFSQSMQTSPLRYPARQTLEASMAIQRLHQLPSDQVIFAKQNPKAIDKGVFHNDVIVLSNQNVFLYHETAFENRTSFLKELKEKLNFEPCLIEVKNESFTLEEAVSTYFFNAQLLTHPNKNHMLLIAPSECENSTPVKKFIDALIHDTNNPIQEVHYFDLKQSMRNGGGPACLRLRVVLSEDELKAMHQGVRLTHNKIEQLERWVKKHYRDKLELEDLCDPQFEVEVRHALDALSEILDLKHLDTFR